MKRKNNIAHKHIDVFNPDVILLDESSYQDFSSEIQAFDAGIEYKNFNEFIRDEAIDYRDCGDGVSYLVLNYIYDVQGTIKEREIVAFYTLSATSIPYEDRIRLEEEEAKESGSEFDIQICGISAVEIKMFAVSQKYQDLFFEYEGQDLPISAWIMKNIISYVNSLLDHVIGLKAVFLHSVPEAEKFYEQNGFHCMKENMRPLHSIDSEFTAMYLSLKEVHMIYDD